MIYLLRFPASGASEAAARLSRHIPDCLTQRYQAILSPRARNESTIAYALLGLALRREYGISPREAVVAAGGGGALRVENPAGIHVSLTHCEGLCACSLGKDRTGIDAERIRPYSHSVAERVCTNEELFALSRAREPDRLFYTLWVLKESFCKAVGAGLSYPMKDVSFRIQAGHIENHRQDCTFNRIGHIEGYAIAQCVLRGEQEGQADCDGGFYSVFGREQAL